MKETLAGVLAGFASCLSFDDLPVMVVEKAKISILDTMACAFDGRLTETCQIALRVYERLRKDGKAAVWAGGKKGAPIDAAWANCETVHSMLHDDTQWSSASHLGSVIVPTSLAVAEEEDRSGREVIAAIVAAYEVSARIGARSHLAIIDRGFRGSGIFGTFAAAVASGKLLRLDEPAMKSAVSCAATFSTGTLEASNCGTMEWRFQNGAALRNGMMAAYLAKEGLRSAETALEGQYGFFRAFGGPELRLAIIDEMEEITASLGKTFDISNNMFKPLATCALNLKGAGIAVALTRLKGIKPGDVESIRVYVNPANKYGMPGIDRSGPFETVDQALLSKPFSIAAAVKTGDLQTQAYLDFLDDPEIAELARKVIIEEDPGIDFVDAEVEFTLKDGSVIRGDKSALDPSSYALSREAAGEKFRQMSAPVLSPAASSRVVEAVFHLEHLSSLTGFGDLLSG
jgi:2-methylcitrate dehydratase PrpD